MLTYDACIKLFNAKKRNKNKVRLSKHVSLFFGKSNDNSTKDIHAYLYNTCIVTITKHSIYTLNASNWHTVTTKKWINYIAPASIFQNKGNWYVSNNNNPKSFYNGIQINKFGQIIDNKNVLQEIQNYMVNSNYINPNKME